MEASRLTRNGKNRLCVVRTGEEVGVFLPESHLSETPKSGRGSHEQEGAMAQEQEVTTVIHLYIQHKGPLPKELTDEIGGRTYGYLHAKGVKCDVVAQIPEFPKQEWNRGAR
jgi:hypothetical protein